MSADIVLMSADIVLMSADIVLMSADIVLMSADIVLMSADIVLMSADIVLMSADIVLMSADIVLMSADIVLMSADIVLMSADIVLMSADIVLMSADIVLMSADIVLMSADISPMCGAFWFRHPPTALPCPPPKPTGALRPPPAVKTLLPEKAEKHFWTKWIDSEPPKYRPSFYNLRLCNGLCNALYEAGFDYPTPIQVAACEEVPRGRDVVLSSETGSGKTLAYLVPALQRMLTAPRGMCIRVVIVLPNRDLCAQTATVARYPHGPSLSCASG